MRLSITTRYSNSIWTLHLGMFATHTLTHPYVSDVCVQRDSWNWAFASNRRQQHKTTSDCSGIQWTPIMIVTFELKPAIKCLLKWCCEVEFCCCRCSTEPLHIAFQLDRCAATFRRWIIRGIIFVSCRQHLANALNVKAKNRKRIMCPINTIPNPVNYGPAGRSSALAISHAFHFNFIVHRIRRTFKCPATAEGLEISERVNAH